MTEDVIQQLLHFFEPARMSKQRNKEIERFPPAAEQSACKHLSETMAGGEVTQAPSAIEQLKNYKKCYT